ncbi:18320_t:CDS:2, partial [Rhizophagus irregularis]
GNKNKDSLPNEGKPFLEYIWINGIPRSDTVIEMEKIIRQQDIFDKASAVRHMCKALEFINKRREIKGTIIVVTFWNIILDMQQIMQVG